MNKAILIMGPTASGKTAIALELSKIYPTEIISVDSALIYRDMNIGTAKPSTDELNIVKHHLIDIISPLESYSVADFVQDSVKIANEVISRGNIPVFVGGTMMYYNALLNGLSELPVSNPDIRSNIEKNIARDGIGLIYDKLKAIDPISASKIKSADTQRIIRALEIYQISGVPMSTLQEQLKPQIKHDFDFMAFRILPTERKILHDRINQRFNKMLNDGLIQEVKDIRGKYSGLTIDHTAMRSVGYKQVWLYLDNELSYEELIETGCAATRQLAKRQLTWLKNMNFNNLKQLIDIFDIDNNMQIITRNIDAFFSSNS